MKEHDLSEVDLRESRQRIRICRGPKEAPRPAYGAAPASAASLACRSSAPAAARRARRRRRTSPSSRARWSARSTSRPNPKAEPYVKVGDRVDTTHRRLHHRGDEGLQRDSRPRSAARSSPSSCEDGEAVEFDKPLFKVDTSADQ